MLAKQMVNPRDHQEMLKLKIKQPVKVDLSGLVKSKTGAELEAFACGVVLDNDTYHGLVTVKIDDSIFKPEIVIRVPWRRVMPAE